jgi:hypothetical protein
MLMHETKKKDLRKVLNLTCNKNFDTYNQKFRMEIIQNVWQKILYMGPKNKMKQDYKTSYMQLKINNYKVVIPCVTIFLIHRTKTN